MRRRASRYLYLLAGSLFCALGIIGMLLPLMPTTVFMLLALACLGRGSPDLAQALLHHRWLGAPLRHWQAERCIPPRLQFVACLSMVGGFVLLASRAPDTLLLCLACVLIMAGMASVLLQASRPGDGCASAWPQRLPACLGGLLAFGTLAGWIICQRPLG